MGLLKFIIFVQLVIALAFFSGQVSIDGLTRTVADTERLVTSTCSKLSASFQSDSNMTRR